MDHAIATPALAVVASEEVLSSFRHLCLRQNETEQKRYCPAVETAVSDVV
ncbi:hypothetical protein HY990_02960 [Candidatus Micrarchaeota archaeon]|nr:hypothetical protein [Candidatus Micrarchaeota archaeon]